MRVSRKLTATQVKAAPPGKHSDGDGLWLHKRTDGGAQWVLRVRVGGKRREMGLGGFPAISLAEARAAAEESRALVRAGKDPIFEREALRRAEVQKREAAQREKERTRHFLKEVARDAFESRKAELKGDGAAGRWFSPLEHHILPCLGHLPVSEITQQDIRNALAPIWHDKAETARKALGRLALCMNHAAALGLSVDLQAPEKARALLGRQRHKPKNIPAMPWKDVPAYYQSLEGGGITRLALRLLILTAVRSRPLRHLHLSQIEGGVWTIPGDGMKGRRDATPDFRVPLSSEALAVIDEARPFARDGYLYPGARKGVISDMTMGRFMERAGLEARPHGFRSSFRDWLAEATDTPHEIAETCMAHVSGSAVERAYRRTDFLEQRRIVMERWAHGLNRLKVAARH